MALEAPEPAEEPSEARRRPSRRTIWLIVTPIVAIVAISTIGNAIHPQLLKDHPLWLIAMEPRNRYLLLVARKVDFIPFLLVAVIRRLLSDPLFYALGHLYGDAGVRWAERRMGEGGGTVIRFYERAFKKAAPIMVFFIPGAIVCLLAGATGMSVPVFVVLNVVGTVLAVTANYYFADVVATPIDAINGFYSRNSRILLVISIAFTVGWVLMQRGRGKGDLRTVSEIERELETERRRVTEPAGEAGSAPDEDAP